MLVRLGTVFFSRNGASVKTNEPVEKKKKFAFIFNSTHKFIIIVFCENNIGVDTLYLQKTTNCRFHDQFSSMFSVHPKNKAHQKSSSVCCLNNHQNLSVITRDSSLLRNNKCRSSSNHPRLKRTILPDELSSTVNDCIHLSVFRFCVKNCGVKLTIFVFFQARSSQHLNIIHSNVTKGSQSHFSFENDLIIWILKQIAQTEASN